jgi:excisionase family DNA binding protein
MTRGRKHSSIPAEPRAARASSARTQVPTSLSPRTGRPSTMTATDRLLTLSEAAFRLGQVHRTTVMRWVKEGGLRCVRLSRKAILFEPAELERFIREHRSNR